MVEWKTKHLVRRAKSAAYSRLNNASRMSARRSRRARGCAGAISSPLPRRAFAHTIAAVSGINSWRGRARRAREHLPAASGLQQKGVIVIARRAGTPGRPGWKGPSASRNGRAGARGAPGARSSSQTIEATMVTNFAERLYGESDEGKPPPRRPDPILPAKFIERYELRFPLRYAISRFNRNVQAV